MELSSTRSDIFGFRHSTVGMLCGAAGSLAGAALMAGVPHPAVVSVAGSVLLALSAWTPCTPRGEARVPPPSSHSLAKHFRR